MTDWDRTLRVWSFDGDCLQEMSGHTSFVYQLDILPSGEFISGGEDKTMRVWKGASENLENMLICRRQVHPDPTASGHIHLDLLRFAKR
jgi:WD40 repeat protein